MDKQQILNNWICTDEIEQLRPSAPQREVLPAPTTQPKRALRPARPTVQPLRPAPSPEIASTEFFAQTGIALAYDVKVLAHHGRVWVVQYQPRFHRDPITPIIRAQRNGRYLRALRRFCRSSIDYEQSRAWEFEQFYHWLMTRRGRGLIKVSKRLALTNEEKRFFEHHVLKFLATGMAAARWGG